MIFSCFHAVLISWPKSNEMMFNAAVCCLIQFISIHTENPVRCLPHTENSFFSVKYIEERTNITTPYIIFIYSYTRTIFIKKMVSFLTNICLPSLPPYIYQACPSTNNECIFCLLNFTLIQLQMHCTRDASVSRKSSSAS